MSMRPSVSHTPNTDSSSYRRDWTESN